MAGSFSYLETNKQVCVRVCVCVCLSVCVSVSVFPGSRLPRERELVSGT